MKRMLAILAVSLPVALPLFAQNGQNGRVASAAATITEDDFAWRVGVIAHDSMQGRNTPSPGLDKTAEWIASEFRRLGLRGGAEDGGFIQRYPLELVAPDLEASGLSSGDVRLRFGTDLSALSVGMVDADVVGGLAVVTGAVSAGALPAGSLAERHALVVAPGDAPPSMREVFNLLGAVRAAGALSLIVTSDLDDAAWRGQVGRAAEPLVRRPGEEGGGRRGGFPIVLIRSGSASRLLRQRGVELTALQERASAPGRVEPLAGPPLTLTQRVRVSPTSAPNVVGIVEGSDPVLRDEYVVFSGHMDHVGIGTPDENGDSIFNGADDDASGTVAVIEVAEAMAALPVAPRRSAIFLLVSGEEKGLWGSDHYSANPSVPVERMVANLNADMVGRNWPDTIVAIGKEHSDLGATLERVNGRHPELRMTAIDDLWPDERFYFRSDHYNFARRGVPVLFFFNGTHPDYHGRDDEPERIDAEKAARIARLLFYLGVEVANADERPDWNPESYRQIVSPGD